ncbi:MAG TPA: alkaline phosphatase family protein [Propionibacteriaceae bacterium]
MFENRSFDHLLGRLYQPGEVASFEGVLGKDLSNPIPEWAEHGADRGVVPYGIATNMNTPYPDPGEEYPHISTQLFGGIDPPSNRGVSAERMIAPYNLPAEPGQSPTMSGFVTDYISAFTAEMGRQPTYDEYSQIMTGYTPEQMPVLSTLARGFATFDHWFADVPSQTFTNRSFFHAATSSGLLVNAPYANFPTHNTAETLFNRLEAHGLTWRIYCDPPSHYSLTGVIHAARLRERFATHFFSTDQFFEDTQTGQLPTYAFIEPQIIGHAHNDMHPAFSMLTPGLNWDPPSSLIAGEDLLARTYQAIRSASSPTGSNYLNTLFMVVFDEHGGTYDHVPPPAATPPDPTGPPGQMDFTFNRLGVRLPAIAISPWIPATTVVNDHYRNTSMIRTMCERWNLGQPLTARDANAADIGPVLTLNQPRAPEDWPDVAPLPVPDVTEPLIPLNQPLTPLAQALVLGCHALAQQLGQTVPTITDPAALNGAEGLAIMHETVHRLWPNLHPTPG